MDEPSIKDPLLFFLDQSIDLFCATRKNPPEHLILSDRLFRALQKHFYTRRGHLYYKTIRVYRRHNRGLNVQLEEGNYRAFYELPRRYWE